MSKTEPFDTHSARYEEWFLENQFVYESELRAVERFIPSIGEGVEIGIGSGKFAGPLGIQTGVEPSAAMRELAEQRGLKVYTAVAEDLPFDDERFDYALMVTTICFVDDIDASFHEIFRILRPGGCVILGFVDRNSLLGRIYEEHKNENVFYRIATFFSTEEVIDLLDRHDFKKPEIIQTVFGTLPDISEVQEAREGYGEGGFIVIKAVKG